MTKEEKDLFVEYKLSVSSVTEEDMGPYHCKVEYPQGEQISQPAYLQIRGKIRTFHYFTHYFTLLLAFHSFTAISCCDIFHTLSLSDQ